MLDQNNRPAEYSRFIEYSSIYKDVTYEKFDLSTATKIDLFALREDFDFASLEKTLDMIIKELPTFKKIFANPIIRLKDSRDVLPVEAVRTISNKTIAYAATHSDLWEDITPRGIKPKKLLSVVNEDHYAIYENLVFISTVDTILGFLAKNARILSNMVYANKNMSFNLLERTNHLSYFLAIGKLHMGYVRDYGKYSEKAEKCLDKIRFITRILRSRTHTPLYKHCKKVSKPLALKKTNVFRSHKDYHRIYVLAKALSESKITSQIEPEQNEDFSMDGYLIFCTMLSVFSAGHFNFSFKDGEKLNFKETDVKAYFSDWSIRIRRMSLGDSSGIALTFFKDCEYNIFLSPNAVDPPIDGEFNEYIRITPFEDEDDLTCVSRYDIESFRRIQQIILRGMIYSDQRRDICPFCGKELSHNSSENSYECGYCRTVITEKLCPSSGEKYFATHIKNFSKNRAAMPLASRDKYLFSKEAEALLHFRNITSITERGDILCPHCKENHNSTISEKK